MPPPPHPNPPPFPRHPPSHPPFLPHTHTHTHARHQDVSSICTSGFVLALPTSLAGKQFALPRVRGESFHVCIFMSLVFLSLLSIRSRGKTEKKASRKSSSGQKLMTCMEKELADWYIYIRRNTRKQDEKGADVIKFKNQHIKILNSFYISFFWSVFFFASFCFCCLSIFLKKTICVEGARVLLLSLIHI